MKTSTKLVTVFAALATLSLQGAFAQSAKLKSDQWPTKANTSVQGGYTGSLLWSTNSVDNTIDQFQDFNNMGDRIQVKDLMGDASIVSKVLGQDIAAMIRLEENSNDLSISADDLESHVKDLYVGFSLSKSVLVLTGKMDVAYGGDVSRRAIDRNNPNHRSLEQFERKIQAVVSVDPSFIKALSAIKQVQFAKFANDTDPNRLNFGPALNSEAYRIIAQIGPILAQASHMRLDSGAKRTSVSGEMGLETAFTGPLITYAEYEHISDSAVVATDVWTFGAEREMASLTRLFRNPTSAYAEITGVKNRTGTSEKNAAAGLKVKLNERVDLGLEYASDRPGVKGVTTSQKDPTVTAQVVVHGKGAANGKSGLFTRIKAKQEARNAEVNKMLDK